MSTSTIFNSKRKDCTNEKLNPTSESRHSLESRDSKHYNAPEHHNNENIPDNKQERIAIKTLELTDPIMSSEDHQKPPKKKRLNLRTRANKAKNEKVQIAMDTDSSDDSVKLQTMSVNNKNHLSKQNELENISELIGNRNDDIASYESKGPNSSVKSCPICKCDLAGLGSDTEMNKHINKCLDNKKADLLSNCSNSKELCQLCWKDISKYNTVQRQQHLNRCCDDSEKMTFPRTNATSYLCPICGKPFKTTKSRQTHMKKCAKENNVSTHQLVELNRQENVLNPPTTSNNSSTSGQSNTKANQDTLGFFKTNKRKRKANLPAKNLDEDTQLALALSASMHSDDVRDPGKRGKKKKTKNPGLPALLLRSENEMKKVTEARAAAVLCQWADNDDDDVQCTPALAPSSLVKKYGSSSADDTENLEVVLEQVAECDIEDITERCDSPTIEVRSGPNTEKEETCGCANESTSRSQRYLTIDTETRLWNLASLRADVVTNNAFYVPNLLPKSTPRKKKATRSASCTVKKDNKSMIEKDKDVNEDSPSKVASQSEGLTESQQKTVEMLVEMISDENSETQSNNDERQKNEEIDDTWFPSSGFCVRKDEHEMKDKNKEHVDTLLNDLSCMVGNPLLSDVEIVAKDNKKFCAHSFMLSARCSTLAEILQTSETCHEDSNSLVRLELLDIDVRAVRAVLTYIYTAYFIPVVENVIEDVKKLAHRWNINCDSNNWKVIREGTGQEDEDNVEHQDDNEGDLDVLLKSLWEGEEEIVTKTEDENVFGDSILDDELGDMEIKIYTQVTPQKNTKNARVNLQVTPQNNSRVNPQVTPQKNAPVNPQVTPQKNVQESNDTTVEHFVQDSDSKDCMLTVKDKTVTDVSGNDVIRSNLESNILVNEDEVISETSDDICIPETPLNLSPCSSPGRHDAGDNSMEYDQTLVEQSPNNILETNISEPIPSVDTSVFGTSSPRCHSSPNEKNFNSSHTDNLNRSPFFLTSPSSVEMMSSPERSPLAEHLNDYDIENDISEFDKGQAFSSNSLVLSSPPVCTNKCLAENMEVSIVSPESRTTSPPICSPSAEDDVLIVDKNEMKETLEFSRLQKDDVNQYVTGPCKNQQNDSLLDIFWTPFDSGPEKSYVYNSNDKDIVVDEDETELLEAEKSDSNQLERHSHEDNTTHKNVDETKGKHSCTITNQPDSCVDESSLLSKNTSNTEAKSNDQKDCFDDNQFIDYNNDDDQLIDFYDDGGFNCDINDYYNDFYNTSHTVEQDNLAPDEEKPGTSSSTAQDTLESNVEEETTVTNNSKKMGKNSKKNFQRTENEKEKTSKDVKKGTNKKTDGKTRKVVSRKVNENPPQELKLRDPRTPMLDYSNMATPDLQGELKEYGVRPLPKRKMVVKLKEIYNYTHREIQFASEADEEKGEKKSSDSKQQSSDDEQVEARSEDTNSQRGSTQDTESYSDSEQNWYDEELSDDADMLSQESSSNLSKTLMSFLTQDHELYFKILKYMPISVSDVLATIKGNGIKCNAEQLKNFFDEQCITYSEPRPARVQRRGRRGRKQTVKSLGQARLEN